MKDLRDLVTIEMNNDKAVFLKVKPDYVFDLQLLGFTGNETGFRVTKTIPHIFQKYFVVNGEPRCSSIEWSGNINRGLINEAFKAEKEQVLKCLLEMGIEI